MRAARLLLGLFILVVVAQHLLQPGLSPSTHEISEYANGSPGWLMTVGFAAWAVALLCTAAVVQASPLAPRPSRIALTCVLAAAALGATLTAAFNTGTSAGVLPAGHRLTVSNHLHDIGSGGLELSLWAALALSLTLEDRRLRRASGSLALLAGLIAITLAGPVGDLPGIRQRALLAVACAWQLVLLSALRRSRPTANG